jgi:hypothetical protein
LNAYRRLLTNVELLMPELAIGASPGAVSAVKPQKGLGSVAAPSVSMQTTPPVLLELAWRTRTAAGRPERATAPADR